MIGLATPYRVYNYGTKLQAYAIQEVIKSYGQSVEVINYAAPYDLRFHILYRKIFTWQKTKDRLAARKTAAAYRSIPGLQEKIASRRKALDSFDHEHLQLSENVRGFGNLTDYSKKYSAVICGSDQIWIPLSTHTEFFTLEFVAPGVRRIAYAPSFGISQVPGHLRRRYRQFLKGIDHLSVRENSGQAIIKELTGSDSTVVLDPTLLLPPEIWHRVIENRPQIVDGQFIFCYFLGKNPAHRCAVKEIARSTGLRVVSFPHFEEMVPEDETMPDVPLYDAKPFDFLNLIKHAKLVCTDSFHGTVFSTVFNKPFVTFERFSTGASRNTNSRIHSLLGNLGLEKRLADPEANLHDLINSAIDYAPVIKKQEDLRKNSAKFLENALGGII